MRRGILTPAGLGRREHARARERRDGADEIEHARADSHRRRVYPGSARYPSVMREFLRKAFALDDGKPCEPTPAQRAVLERLAAEVARRRMSGPALAFLEMSRPLNALGAAVVQFFAPIATTLASPVALKEFAEFLERRGSVEVLCRLIEAAERERAKGCCEGAPTDGDART